MEIVANLFPQKYAEVIDGSMDFESDYIVKELIMNIEAIRRRYDPTQTGEKLFLPTSKYLPPFRTSADTFTNWCEVDDSDLEFVINQVLLAIQNHKQLETVSDCLDHGSVAFYNPLENIPITSSSLAPMFYKKELNKVNWTCFTTSAVITTKINMFNIMLFMSRAFMHLLEAMKFERSHVQHYSPNKIMHNLACHVKMHLDCEEGIGETNWNLTLSLIPALSEITKSEAFPKHPFLRRVTNGIIKVQVKLNNDKAFDEYKSWHSKERELESERMEGKELEILYSSFDSPERAGYPKRSRLEGNSENSLVDNSIYPTARSSHSTLFSTYNSLEPKEFPFSQHREIQPSLGATVVVDNTYNPGGKESMSPTPQPFCAKSFSIPKNRSKGSGNIKLRDDSAAVFIRDPPVLKRYRPIPPSPPPDPSQSCTSIHSSSVEPEPEDTRPSSKRKPPESIITLNNRDCNTGITRTTHSKTMETSCQTDLPFSYTLYPQRRRLL